MYNYQSVRKIVQQTEFYKTEVLIAAYPWQTARKMDTKIKIN